MATAVGAAAAIPALGSGQSPPAPRVATGAATGVGADAAVAHGSVDTAGAPTTYSFRYGPTARYGRHTAPVALPAGSAPVAVEARLPNLDPGVRYHYRLSAANAFGTGEGEDRTFETAAPSLSGNYAVHVRVVAGGRPFGQHPGDGGPRRYRFTPDCPRPAGSEGCGGVSLRRSAQRGKFGSHLKEVAPGRWKGSESHRGHCDDGLEFRSRSQIAVHAEGASSARVRRVAGELHTVVRGCVEGSERTKLKGTAR